MEFLSTFLPILLYIAGFVLLIILIIIGLKVINILDRTERIVEDIENKVSSFDEAVSLFSKVATGIADMSNSLVFGVSSVVSKIFKKNKEKEDFYE